MADPTKNPPDLWDTHYSHQKNTENDYQTDRMPGQLTSTVPPER
jgi:hypothetical protein